MSSFGVSPSSYVQPVLRTDGRLGHLTPEQVDKLKEFWICVYDIFDGKMTFDQTAPTSFKGQVREEDTETTAGVLSWFGRSFRGTTTSTVRFSGQDLYKAFWKMIIMEHPDAVLLKFLRARKWVLEDVLKMFVSTLKWRLVERIDEVIELSDVEIEAKNPNFVQQFRMGKAFFFGADPLGRPVITINTRVHHKSEQPPETLHRFTLHTLECARMLASPESESVIVIFDLSSFGLHNMDWPFVRLFVQCFESYYPEFLGVCVIHRAPVVFWDLWRLIQPLLDPQVASRFIFTRNNEELHRVIPQERLPITHFDGLNDWNYEYVPPREGENNHMQDVATKERLLQERRALEVSFDQATRVWMKEPGHQPSSQRDQIALGIQEQYGRMSPYVRARNLYHRWGVLDAKEEAHWKVNVRQEPQHQQQESSMEID
ncbi:CRAL-TRIO domain-containing protein [Mortierella sp. GBAus27b]|nr:hypothetical protein BGX31_006838 [Mortierella sp. GBA43]KAI8350953.1 CRAL-TRIO domain-containing protein [Mortierella sp. GBAus27b]